LVSVARVERAAGFGLMAAISWRNLQRNRSRTWLAAGGIAFAVMLILAARSAQFSSMTAMLDNATRMLTGHVQIQNPAYAADPALRNLIPDATEVARALAKVPDVTAVAPRAVTFALVSVGDRSYGAQVMGVDATAERTISSLPDMLTEGRYLEGPTDAVVGSVMARNLGAKLGDELVILGTMLDGGVAAMSLRITGIVDTGTPDLDRALIQVELAAFQDAFGLGDQVHVVVARVTDFTRVAAIVPGIEAALTPFGANLSVLSWQRLLPELAQTTELKRASSSVMFGLIALLVTFSVFNSFMMTVFERTREFGVLLAIGMRPNGIIGVLQLEAVWLALLGAGAGVVLGSALIAWVGHVGIPLGEMVGEMLRRYHLPDRIYPVLDVDTLILAPVLMFCATQFAALIPSLRIRRLAPVDALRVDA
jgi:ABC-type lipoprotein release transport system permease subunit